MLEDKTDWKFYCPKKCSYIYYTYWEHRNPKIEDLEHFVLTDIAHEKFLEQNGYFKIAEGYQLDGSNSDIYKILMFKE